MNKLIMFFVLGVLIITPAYATKKTWADRCSEALSKSTNLLASELVIELKKMPTNKIVGTLFLVDGKALQRFERIAEKHGITIVYRGQVGSETFTFIEASRATLADFFRSISETFKKQLPYSWVGLSTSVRPQRPEVQSEVFAGAPTRTYILAVKRSERSKAPDNWFKKISQVAGVTVINQGEAEPFRIMMIDCASELADSLRSNFPFLHFEEKISYSTTSNLDTVLPMKERTYKFVLEKAEKLLVLYSAEFGIISPGIVESEEHGGPSIMVYVFRKTKKEARTIAEAIKARTNGVFEGVPLTFHSGTIPVLR